MDYGLISFLESKDDFKRLNVGDIVLYRVGDNWYSAKVEGRGKIFPDKAKLFKFTDGRIQKERVESSYMTSDFYLISADLFDLAKNKDEIEFIRKTLISETPMNKRHYVDMIMSDLDNISQNYRKPEM